jgi:hypothetical protein
MSSNKMVFPPIHNATGDTILEYHETSHRLIVCHSANSGSDKGLMHCTVPFKLPLHTCIPLLLPACTNDTKGMNFLRLQARSAHSNRRTRLLQNALPPTKVSHIPFLMRFPEFKRTSICILFQHQRCIP